MAEQLSYTMSVIIPTGPKMGLSQVFEVEAYDKIKVAIEKDVPQTVEVAPGTGTSVQFMVITADNFPDAVTYTIGSGTQVHKLDAPHVYASAGQLEHLGSLGTLQFTSTADDPVSVEILVGRDATP